MISAIITAAGKGTRLQSNISKQFIHIYGKPILAHTLKSFQDCEKIDEIYVVIPKNYEQYCEDEIVKKYKFTKVKKLITGGDVRQESVFNALKVVSKDCKIVSVHDGVRPLITPEDISNIIDYLLECNIVDSKVKGVILAAPAYETVKKIDNDNNIEYTITRNLVCMAQTPQTFFYNELFDSYKKAFTDNFIGTDDASLVERAGWKVKVLIGHHENIKITTPTDLFLAELIMKKNGSI